MALTKIDDRGLKTPIDLLDNEKIRLGTGNDLELYHDGTDNHIVSTNGQINIQTSSTENSIQCIPDGQVKLFYNNVLQVSTSSTGITFEDSKKANFGGESDLSIYHDGSNSYIDDSGTGNLLVRGNNIELHKHTGEDYLKCIANGAVELYHDNSKKLETTSSGIDVQGQIHALGTTPQLRLNSDTSDGSSTRAMFGMATSANNFVNGAAVNDVVLNCPKDFIISHGTDEIMAQFKDDSSVELYCDGSKKFETTSSGVSVTGGQTITSYDGTTGLGQLNFGASGTPNIKAWDTGNHGSGSKLQIRSGDGDTHIECNRDGNVELYHDNTKKFETGIGGEYGSFTATNGANGWDGMAVGGSAIVFMGSSTAAGIWNDTDNEWMLKSTRGGATELQYDGSEKFRTTSDGVLIGDGLLCKFGTGSDAYISHTGSDFNIINSTGVLVIGNNSGTGVGEGSVVFKSGNNNARWTLESGGNFVPASNNAFAIGSSSNRVSVIYSNAALNTSDKTLKNTITTSDLGLDFINKLKPVSYKWNQYEGEISDTRTHYGLIAQDVEEVITSSGKTLNDFGGVDKPDKGYMGLAYSQFVSPLIKAVQELSAELETLKTKVAALEGA